MVRLAYQGEPGAFGEDACRRWDPAALAVAHPSVDAAIAAVGAGACDAAVLPVHNSVAGPVEMTVSRLPAPGLVETGMVDVPIVFALLGVPGATLAGLRSVAAHPMGLKQCARIIAALGLEAVAAPNNAVAARETAEAANPAHAALAAAAAAALYGLVVLDPAASDVTDAVTRFVVLGRSQ